MSTIFRETKRKSCFVAKPEWKNVLVIQGYPEVSLDFLPLSVLLRPVTFCLDLISK